MQRIHNTFHKPFAYVFFRSKTRQPCITVIINGFIVVVFGFPPTTSQINFFTHDSILSHRCPRSNRRMVFVAFALEFLFCFPGCRQTPRCLKSGLVGAMAETGTCNGPTSILCNFKIRRVSFHTATDDLSGVFFKQRVTTNGIGRTQHPQQQQTFLMKDFVGTRYFQYRTGCCDCSIFTHLQSFLFTDITQTYQ